MRISTLVLALVLLSGCRSGPEPVLVGLETTKGEIVVRLEPAKAPVTVENFLVYVDEGAYDGTLFHRVIPGFMIQGGGYDEAFVELPSRDPIVNEWQRGVKNERGTIAMAREENPDSATRQFFINVADNAPLDTAREKTGNAGYAAFGRVVSGMDVADAIVSVERGSRPDLQLENVPTEPVVLLRARRIED